METAKLPYGSLAVSMCKVNEIATKNCTTSNVFEDLDISDVLESIKLLLDYIKKRKQRELRSRARMGGWGEKRIHGASQDRSATARGGVAGFFSRKRPVTAHPY
ncbi:MAG: hypothetical protein Q7S75_00690 [bacterium]|nr:hypothetical protein [bacterium]